MKNDFITIKLSKTNCFLLKAKEGYLLIDCGYEWDRDLLVKRLDRHDIRASHISHLFLTHHHDDHSGLANYLVGKNPKIRVIMHKECARLIKKGENDTTRGGGYINKKIYFLSLVNKMLNPEWNLKFPPYSVRPQDIIINNEEDDTLRDIGISGSILFTPGHSADSISLLMDDRVLFAGDAAMNWLKWAGSRYATLFITDTDEFYSSWEKIIARNPRMIFPAHGAPFMPGKLLKNLRRIENRDLVKIF